MRIGQEALACLDPKGQSGGSSGISNAKCFKPTTNSAQSGLDFQNSGPGCLKECQKRLSGLAFQNKPRKVLSPSRNKGSKLGIESQS